MVLIIKHYVNITSDCNLNCSFCFRDKNKYKLNLDDIIYMINNISKDDYLVLYGGEPTLKPKELDKIYNSTKAKLILVTNGTNYEYLKNNLHKFDIIQVSIYKGYEDIQLKVINDINCYSHLVLCSSYINDFSFIDKILTNINPKDKIWMSLDLTMKNSDNNRKKIDEFIKFISKYDFNLYSHLFLQDNKEYPGRECDHLYNNSMYINTDGKLHNCSHSKEKTIKNLRCSNCDNIYCRACVCNIPIIDRDIQCYFYNNIRNLIEGR